MKASAMIARVDRKHDNSIELEDKLTYLDTVEKNIFAQIVTELYEEKMDLVKDQSAYTLDEFIFEDIIKLKVNGTEYTLGSAMIQQDGTYYKMNGKLCFKAFNRDIIDGLVIMRRWKPAKLTEDTYAEQDLMLPDTFEDAYEYYMRAQICLEQKNAAGANAYAGLYNEVIKDFSLWYIKQQPNVAAYKTNQRWGN